MLLETEINNARNSLFLSPDITRSVNTYFDLQFKKYKLHLNQTEKC